LQGVYPNSLFELKKQKDPIPSFEMRKECGSWIEMIEYSLPDMEARNFSGLLACLLASANIIAYSLSNYDLLFSLFIMLEQNI